MTQEKARDEAVDKEREARCCCGQGEGESRCCCAACRNNARWAGLALLIGGLGILALKAARRRAGSEGSKCCGA